MAVPVFNGFTATHPAATSARPVVWSISGSDSGGGAGLQADLRALDAFDLHACTAVAAITAQNSVAVVRVQAVAVDLLEAQLDALALDLPPAAIKTGMLGSLDNLRAVVRCIDRLRLQRPTALVVDPVWRASTGVSLASDALRDAMLQELLPRATLATPNRAEAAWLLGLDAQALRGAAAVVRAAAQLRQLTGADIIITGGDIDEAEDEVEGATEGAVAGADADTITTPFLTFPSANPGSLSVKPVTPSTLACDWLDTAQATGWLTLPRQQTRHHHGTGCVFASSAAAALAWGFCTADAAVFAKMATAQALSLGYAAGRGAGPVRPRRGFALNPDFLPALHGGTELPQLPQSQSKSPSQPSDKSSPWAHANHRSFAPLQDRFLGLYAIVDSAVWIERLVDAGVRTLQLRIKDPHAPQLERDIARSVQCARAAGVQLFINDHWQLALAHGAYGIHLGQEDLATADLAAIQAAGIRLGISTHSPWEVCRAHALQPSYIAVGPVHATTTKDMPWLPQGTANLAYWCQVLTTPVVAIAGMDAARSTEAMRCGAAGVAVLRGIVQADAPEDAVRLLTRAVLRGSQAGANNRDDGQENDRFESHVMERIAAPPLPQPTLPLPMRPDK